MLLAPGLVLLPEDPDEFCITLGFFLRAKQGRNGSKIMAEELVAVNDKLLYYNCVTTTRQKNLLFDFELKNTKKLLNLFSIK